MVDEDPDDLSDSIEKLEERKEYLEEWTRRHLAQQKAARLVQENLERTSWQLNVLLDRPEEASEIPVPPALEPKRLEQENWHLTSTLPLPQDYDIVRFYNSTAVSTSASAEVFVYVSRVGDIDSDTARNYYHKYTSAYLDLQKEQQRSQQVKELLEKLGKPGLLGRFQDASVAYQDYKIDPGKRKAAANAMRNLLYGFQGELQVRARRKPKENMPWDKMSERLANGGKDGFTYQRLLEEGPKFSSLIERLSPALKDREGGSVANLEFIWSNVLDHIYTVLSLVRME